MALKKNHPVDLIWFLYTNQEAVIRWNNERTETFSIDKSRGVTPLE